MKISISGLGVMGKNHLRCCSELGYEIVSTFEPNNNDNYEDFLNTLKNVDAIVIASPTKYHTSTIIDAKNVNKNIKILCEKPITFSNDDINIEKILEYENDILVGQIERFNPVCVKVKDLLIKQNIVQIRTRRVNNIPSREHIDCRKDIGIHDLDFCFFVLDNLPEKINIMSNKDNTHEVMSYKIKNTQVINEISWLYPFKDRNFEILTDSGLYCGHYFKQTLTYHDWKNDQNEIMIDKMEPLRLELNYLAKMVYDNVATKNKLTDNLKILKLLGY